MDNIETINRISLGFIIILSLVIGFYKWRLYIIQKAFADKKRYIASDPHDIIPYKYHTFTFSNIDVESGRASAKLNEYGNHGWRVCGQWAIGNFLHVFMKKAPNHEQTQ